MEKESKGFFKWLRVIALTALFCTCALMLALWVESLLPGDISGAQSEAVGAIIGDVVHIDDQPEIYPKKLTLLIPEGPKFIGDKIDTHVIYSPSNATVKDVFFTSSNSQVATVDNNGQITITGKGEAVIRVYFSDDESITAKDELISFGVNPDDYDALNLMCTGVAAVGQVAQLTVSDDDGNILDNLSLDFTADADGFIALNNAKSEVYFLQAGSVILTASANGKEKAQITFDITESAGFTAPATFELENTAISLRKHHSMFIGDGVLVSSAQPSSAPTYYIASIQGDSVTLNGATITAQSAGISVITLVSPFNPDCTAEITVNAYEVPPTGLELSGYQSISYYNSHRFSAHLLGDNDNPDVVWTIVKGKHRADISELGIVTPRLMGKIIVRATSVTDPEIYDEMEIRIVLYTSFSSFVRKVLGHFAAFALLGFGLMFSFFMLLKPRWLSPLPAITAGFGVAGLSEMLQLPLFTQGRGSSWADVVIDLMGVATGMGVALLTLGAICLIWYLANRNSFATLRADFSRLTFKSAFAKKQKIES